MKTYKALLIVVFLFLASSAYAGIRPSFGLDFCTWEATNILVVTESEEIDGRFIVLESLKGDLKSGGIIMIPEFAAFKPQALRQIGTELEYMGSSAEEYRLSASKKTSRMILTPEMKQQEVASPGLITCARMILFLKKNDNGSVISWKSANNFGGFFVSAIWLEFDKSYAFYQQMNPGPTALLPINSQEIKIRESISELLKLQNSLHEVLLIKENKNRAEALEPFLRSSFWLAKNMAFEEIKKCGVSSLPVLRRLMNDSSRWEDSTYVFAALAEISGEQIGDELVRIVGEELQFWKETTPKLKKGWWNGSGKTETENLRNRYGRVDYALTALRKIKFANCKEIVTEFRDFWRSQPVLEDNSGLDQMSKECDSILAEISHQ
jgi:hypothetical protein